MPLTAWLRALRLANPVVRLVLDSPAHRLLSARLAVLEYRGRRSGRTFRIPLRYAETSRGAFVVLAVRAPGKLWWRSFEAPAQATLLVRGRRLPVRGGVVHGDRRRDALAAYLAAYRRSDRVARDAAVVVFERTDG